ncbi:hypothetical protein P3X46_026953 [Hevea brasiliensis]|uniref:Sec20 C-terminal domain-containing protein n=1 Tax=Hevea brasiliensis TaxID=3981 RepID=A0ABQ9KYA5_HEVBR|nr:uncharacterized protein LOC110670317 isoform X2 [Hevea brasiliensis]XP_057992979.1 uncharacterized protein LOC110670317 isoform X2 [Hevea brasiliensis]KAJ9153525.1 hypothetical protein P3X46_026953 [Hevea brasiliensis]
MVEKSPQFADSVCKQKTGMTSAEESITESLCHTHQLMFQEVERSASTLMTFEKLLFYGGFAGESTGVLRKAESEYKGHHSLFMRTQNLLSKCNIRMFLTSIEEKRGFFYPFDFYISFFTTDIELYFDRMIPTVGFFVVSCAVLYVISKRIGLLKLQTKSW